MDKFSATSCSFKIASWDVYEEKMGTQPQSLKLEGNVQCQALTPNFVRSPASAGSNGTISPKGTLTVTPGASKTFTIKPNTYFQIADVEVDGVSKGAITSYTFSNVTSSHSISATFLRKGSR